MNAEILTLIITAAALGIVTLAALAVIKALEYAIKAIMRKGRRCRTRFPPFLFLSDVLCCYRISFYPKPYYISLNTKCQAKSKIIH